MNGRPIRTFLVWLLLVAALTMWAGATRVPRTGVLVDASISPVRIHARDAAFLLDGGDATVHYTTNGAVPTDRDAVATGRIDATPDRRRTDGLVRIPTSVQWRSPLPGQPAAAVVRARTCANGVCGPVSTRTRLEQKHALPVIALTADPGAFFDADTGIQVPGHGIFRAGEEAVQRFPRDHRWWKYPGNFQFRGKEWERQAVAELFATGGRSMWSGDVRLRIHGNNTRGFPQHAMRMRLDPSPVEWFGPAHGAGHRTVVLRAGGNDQADSFMRDVVQHRLCEGLPFHTSAAAPVVVYINGAYWGVHHVRERIDADELARRHGGPAGAYTVLEDRLLVYDGDQAEVKRFERMITMAGRWDARSPGFADSLGRRMDVDGFLTYMAAQIILGNMDWPDQNVRYWRWTGLPDTVPGPRDGRWRFIMGDSDMGLGYAAPPSADVFAHVARHQGPVARLYVAIMRAPVLRARMRSITEGLLNGPLSEASMRRAIDTEQQAMAPEMTRHVARWRRPEGVDVWNGRVEELRAFARDRVPAVRAQLDRHFKAD